MPDRLRLNEGNRKWWTLAAMCFALFMIMLDNTVVNVALPSIQRDLGASLSSLEWTVNAYTLTFAVLLVTGGRLGDIFGRRRVFLGGVMLFAASSALIGLAPTQHWLVAGRAVQGMGAAFMMPGTLSIISNTFPPQERGRAIGMWAGVSALALAVGPAVGGALTEYVSWRAIFFLNLPVAVGAVVVTLFAVRESSDATVDRRVDFAGIGTLSVGLSALVLALVEGNGWGWGSPAIVVLLVMAVVGLVAFALVETRGKAPMVQFEFFRSRSFLGANVVAFIVSFAMLAMFFFIALYMQNILHYSALDAGIRFLPTTVVIIFAAPIAGRLADRIGPRIPMTVGLSLAALALFLQSQLDTGSGYGALLVPFAIMGLGMGLTMSPMSTAAMNSVSPDKAGVASGILSMSRMVGGTFGVASIGALFQSLSRGRLAEDLSGLHLTAAQHAQIVDGLGSGQSSDALKGLDPAAAQQVGGAMKDAFVHALSGSLKLSTGVAAAGAVLAFVLIEKKVGARRPAERAAAAAGEAQAAEPTAPTAEPTAPTAGPTAPTAERAAPDPVSA
jgi:EmrB/QacA subfamily drug resistance transporter